MKIRKLIGVTLMLSALLMQIGYAASTLETVGTKSFNVKFEGEPQVAQSKYMEVTTQVENQSIKIVTHNLYPGGRFSVVCTIRNVGEQEVEITNVQVKEIQNESNSHELFQSLEGYINNEVIKDGYEQYLMQSYKGKILKPNEKIEVMIDMGLPIEITGLQNMKTEFDIIMQFSQPHTSGGGNGGSQGGGDKPDIDIQDPEKPIKDPINPEAINPIETPEEMDVGDEILEIKLPDDIVLEDRIDNEKINKNSLGGVLPQTGGVPPGLIYSIGIILLGSGLAIYRKK